MENNASTDLDTDQDQSDLSLAESNQTEAVFETEENLEQMTGATVIDTSSEVENELENDSSSEFGSLDEEAEVLENQQESNAYAIAGTEISEDSEELNNTEEEQNGTDEIAEVDLSAGDSIPAGSGEMDK